MFRDTIPGLAIIEDRAKPAPIILKSKRQPNEIQTTQFARNVVGMSAGTGVDGEGLPRRQMLEAQVADCTGETSRIHAH